MFSILHITDLHRAKGDPISNAELLSAIMSDMERYPHETPPIAPPNAIIVSGDIIQGVALNDPNFRAEISDQYDAAYDFLKDLTDRILGGDRSRVIIVPGNHDIDWNTALSSMSVVKTEDYPKDLLRALNDVQSPYRWHWKSQQLYIIRDQAEYEKRFGAYWQFIDRFYADLPEAIRPKTWSDANIYSLDRGRIGVVAFNSCTGNDCFRFHGEIRREVIGQAYLDLADAGPWHLKVAVWHHDIQGPPDRSDYMDSDIVRGMIGRGFRLGLYGHQHRPQITPEHIYTPDQETMAVASAGSLCAGEKELPTGARRGYSVIEIRDDYLGARVHVREMAFANLFSRATLPIFGGKSYVDLEWTKPLDSAGRPENPDRAEQVAKLLLAEDVLFGQKNPERALTILLQDGTITDPHGKKLLIECLTALNSPAVTVDVLGNPTTIEELVLLVDSQISLRAYDLAASTVTLHSGALEVTDPQRAELLQKISLARQANP